MSVFNIRNPTFYESINRLTHGIYTTSLHKNQMYTAIKPKENEKFTFVLFVYTQCIYLLKTKQQISKQKYFNDTITNKKADKILNTFLTTNASFLLGVRS